jgi:hypothetical protein
VNFNIKKYLLAYLICLGAFTAKAQLGYEYAQYDIGIGGSLNTVFADLPTGGRNPVGHLNFNYNVNPFINYVFEFQTGNLHGNLKDNGIITRGFINNFSAVVLRGQVQAGEIIDYSRSRLGNALKNLYFSTGIGYINNHIKEVTRGSDPGLDNSSNLMIPARIGYEFKVFNRYSQPSFKIDIGYQYNYLFGDNMDGLAIGTTKDAYSQLNVSFKFALGSITSYKKQIHY